MRSCTRDSHAPQIVTMTTNGIRTFGRHRYLLAVPSLLKAMMLGEGSGERDREEKVDDEGKGASRVGISEVSNLGRGDLR